MLDLIKTFYPVNEQLKPFIYCYYLIEDTPDDLHNLHYAFPHTYNAVSIYKSAELVNHHQHFIVSGKPGDESPLCILQGKCSHPLLVELNGKVSRLTILFKPLGLNKFVKGPLDDLFGDGATHLPLWLAETLTELTWSIFNDNDIASRLLVLENYLLRIYQPFHQPLLEESLTYLSDFDRDLSIKEIAELINLPLRTFNRLFKTHLGVSPATHRQIARFRHSLENKLFNEQLQKLTTIGYQSNFYDQSYFNKIYRQLSGSNPGKFFKSVKQVGDSNLVFQFVG